MGAMCPDESISWLNISGMPVRDADGQLAGVVATYADIASHDLQEPLRKDPGLRDRLAASEGLDERGRDYLQWMTGVAGRMQLRQVFQNLISNALKFHRPDVALVVAACVEQVDGRDIRSLCRIIVTDKGRYARVTARIPLFGFREIMAILGRVLRKGRSMELRDKRALVTGGGRGIGRAIALALAAAGADVALLARSEGELRETAVQIGALGREALVCAADLAVAGEVDAALDQILAAWNGIDILVNNAGIQGPIGKMHEVPVADWWKVVEVNLGGCFLSTRRVLPGMVERRYGKIINLSGGGAVSARPFFSAYSASKAAVVRLTETLAAEVSEYNIDVNAIAPGAVNTRMLDERLAVGQEAGSAELEADKKLLQDGGTDPQRPAALVVYLASPRSDGLSGRLLAAVWDPWEDLDVEAVMASEAYTVRRLKMEE